MESADPRFTRYSVFANPVVISRSLPHLCDPISGLSSLMHGVGSSLRTQVARFSRRVVRASKPRDSKYPVATSAHFLSLCPPLAGSDM